MPAIIDNKNNLYRPLTYKKEDELEELVVQLADQIFGPSTIYVDIKKKIGKEVVTIPDGYLIDMTEPDIPRLFVIENEIVNHDPFEHVGIQLLKFITSFDDAQIKIKEYLMDQISKDKRSLSRLEEGCVRASNRNIDSYLEEAVYGKFRGIVIIDEARTKLNRIIENIDADISILELRTFEAEKGIYLHQFDTLYDEYEDYSLKGYPRRASKKLSAAERTARQERRASADTIIVPAREEGFREVFLGKNQWYEIRVGAAMKEKIRYIAAYQVAPISAVTYIAEVLDIRPYKDTGKYVVLFKGPAKKIKKPVKIKETRYSPQGPVYAKREDLLKASCLEDALS